MPANCWSLEPGRTSVVAHWEPEGVDTSISPLLVHGHLDVVPANADDWSVPPFSGELVDGCIWGRGAVDMKDFDAMVLSVVRARARAGAPPRRPIRLIFTADEEAGGGLGAKWLVEKHREVVEGCQEAIGEVGGFSLTVRDDLRLYLIQTAEKGMAWLDLIAEGQAGHGSLRQRSTTRSLSSARPSPGSAPTSGPGRSPTRSGPFWRRLPRHSKLILIRTGSRRVWRTLAASRGWLAATMSNTANPTMLSAGYKHNVIPGRAEAGVDGRFLPGSEEEFYATIADLIRRQGSLRGAHS